MKPTLEAVIGLEVHCQLATRSKAFTGESATFVPEANTHIRPFTLGHPGTLPVFNRRAVEFTLRMGLATHSDIQPVSVFARKHYFYPDLPKGYQISQYERPICTGGYVTIPVEEGGRERRIRLTRIHMEEDAGKSIHDAEDRGSLLDYNRAGVPLIEIVSEPDLRTPREAYHYMRRIRQLVRYLDICDGNMEEGSLRCDANVSIKPAGAKQPGTKTEIKNLNSFRFLEKALEYEIERQTEIMASAGSVVHETRLWDDEAGVTRSMRSKEDAHDYRYFPDPDLPPVVVEQAMLEAVRSKMPALPADRRRLYVEQWKLPDYDADVLTEEKEVADYFEECARLLGSARGGAVEPGEAKAVSNILMTSVMRVLNDRSIEIGAFPIDAERLSELVGMRLDDDVSSTGAQEIFDRMLENEAGAKELAEALDLLQVKDAGRLRPVVVQVLDDHPEEVGLYLSGKSGLFGFFMGGVMRSFPGSPDPREVRAILTEELEKRK